MSHMLYRRTSGSSVSRPAAARVAGLALAAAAALAACSAEPEVDTGDCSEVDTVVLDQIASRVTDAVSEDFALTGGSAVPADEHGSGFIVAARIEAKGIQVGFGYWWLDSLDGDAATVLWASSFADQFTSWPSATTLSPPVDPEGADIDAARNCLANS